MFENNVRPKIEIYRAEVIEVYPERGTCDLITRDTENKLFQEVPWSSPFTDLDGSGIDFCPVEGQLCYMLANTSNAQEIKGISSVILGWSFPEVDGSYGVGRELLSRNDLKLANRKGAKILLDANRGDLLMQSGASCGMTLYRMANLMHLLADTYKIETRGGHVLWETSGLDQDDDRVRYSCAVKSRAGDEVGFLRVLASSDRSGDFFEVRLTGTDADSGQFSPSDTSDLYKRPSQYAKIRFSSDGTGVIHSAGTLDLSANEQVRIRSLNDVHTEGYFITGEARGPGSADRTTFRYTPRSTRFVTDELEIEAKSFVVKNRADGEVLLRTADNQAYQDEENRKLFTETLQYWLFNHTHPNPSLPPMGRPSDVPVMIGDRVLTAQEFAEVTYAEEIAKVYDHRVLAGMCLTLSALLEAIQGVVGPAPEQALTALLEAEGLIPPGVGNLGLWFSDAADDYKSRADALEQANESVELNANGEPTLIDQQYGVSSINDVITRDTKVR